MASSSTAGRFGHGRIVATEALERLAGLGETLMCASALDEVVEAILEIGLTGAGADTAAVVLLDGEVLRLLAQHNLPAASIEAFPLPVSVDIPIAEAARTASPIWIDDRDQRDRWYPLLRDQSYAVGASGILPMQVDGVVIGVLGVGFTGDHLFSETERSYCSVLAGMSALALSRHGSSLRRVGDIAAS